MTLQTNAAESHGQAVAEQLSFFESFPLQVRIILCAFMTLICRNRRARRFGQEDFEDRIRHKRSGVRNQGQRILRLNAAVNVTDRHTRAARNLSQLDHAIVISITARHHFGVDNKVDTGADQTISRRRTGILSPRKKLTGHLLLVRTLSSVDC